MSEFEIGPVQLKQKMERGDKFVLLDVRQPHEADICTIPGSYLIPLGQLFARAGELNPAEELIVYCHSGQRSAWAVRALQQSGFMNVKNLTGGILAWSEEVDPSVPRY